MIVRYLCFNIIFLILSSNYAHGSPIKTFLIHLEDRVIEYRKNMPDFDTNVPDVLKVIPEKVYKSSIKKDLNFMVLKADPLRSDVRDIFFIYQFRRKYEVIDYKYDTSGNSIEDVLLWDFDNDNINEIVLLWSNEDTYQIRIYKLQVKDNTVDAVNVYNSHGLGNPAFTGYGRKLCIVDNNIFALYQYYYDSKILHKYSKLTSNPDDNTKEIYLMPIGVLSKEEWIRIEKKCKN